MGQDVTDYIHPITGEVLATEDEWRAAIRTLEERLSEVYRDLWPLREKYAERFPPAELPARRYRTDTQEKVARCPRCGTKIEDDLGT